MTEKLYYKDAYIKKFTARVISIEKLEDEEYDIVLDRTAFFPMAGGQKSDTGYIENAPVISVLERQGIIHHITPISPIAVGNEVECEVDFDSRFEKMQCHTAEHILCGLLHRIFLCENVGFHLGDEDVTFDIDKVLTREQLDLIEDMANRAVFDNIEVTTFFPTPDELSSMEYRSKLELTENVRIVKIGDIDTCACCAPHVSRTGEIGIIKILDFSKHKGGMRIHMLAGARALKDYRNKYTNVKRISELLWEPQETVADGLEKYISDTEKIKNELHKVRLKIALDEADEVTETEGNAVFCFDDFSIDDLRAFSNAVLPKISGVLVTLTHETQGRIVINDCYKYVISSRTVDLTTVVKSMNKALSGKGGGKSGMVQGTFYSSLKEIESYVKYEL